MKFCPECGQPLKEDAGAMTSNFGNTVYPGIFDPLHNKFASITMTLRRYIESQKAYDITESIKSDIKKEDISHQEAIEYLQGVLDLHLEEQIKSIIEELKE